MAFRSATSQTNGRDVLNRAQEGSGGGAVGAVGDFYGEADHFVVAGFDFGEVEAFDDPDFRAEQGVVGFYAVFVEAADGEVIDANGADAAVSNVFGGFAG